MTKMPKYNEQRIVASCLTCYSMMCKNTYHPFFVCVCKAFKQNEKYQLVVNENNVLGITWWIRVSTGNNSNLRQGGSLKNIWRTQTKLNFGVTTILLTLAWDPQHLEVQCMYNHIQASNTQWQQGMCWVLHWPVRQKWTLGEVKADLGIMEQAEFTFNEE